ncbi:MAG TPA: hypothetical protein VJ814_10170 [Gaiellaceae bacterium]|nr:hypothetical protein [Gaiellaceae bacterium]
MSLLDRLRNLLSGPPHIADSGDDAGEFDADMHEEYGAPDEGKADLERMENLSGGAVVPGIATSEAAEAGEEDIETEEAPPDPDP